MGRETSGFRRAPLPTPRDSPRVEASGPVAKPRRPAQAGRCRTAKPAGVGNAIVRLPIGPAGRLRCPCAKSSTRHHARLTHRHSVGSFATQLTHNEIGDSSDSAIRDHATSIVPPRRIGQRLRPGEALALSTMPLIFGPSDPVSPTGPFAPSSGPQRHAPPEVGTTGCVLVSSLTSRDPTLLHSPSSSKHAAAAYVCALCVTRAAVAAQPPLPRSSGTGRTCGEGQLQGTI